MRALRRFIHKQEGYVEFFVILYCLIAFAGLCAEYFRVIDLREEAENIIQRGINIAIERTLLETERRDFFIRIDPDATTESFYRYLHDSANLDGSYRMVSSSGVEVWRLEDLSFTHRDEFNYETQFTVKGKICTSSILSIFTGSIEFPFTISSKTVRLD